MMKASDKIDLIDKIGRALQSKYTFDQPRRVFRCLRNSTARKSKRALQ